MSKTNNSTFAEMVAAHLNRGRETPASLADHLQVSYRSVYRWQNGESVPTDLETLMALGRVMGVSLEELSAAIQRQ